MSIATTAARNALVAGLVDTALARYEKSLSESMSEQAIASNNKPRVMRGF
jgi:hypothetical protein